MFENKFVIDENSTILEALKKIDENKRSYLLIVNEENVLLGLITEGDIRRLLINNAKLEDKVSYNQHIEKVYNSEEFNILFEKFKSERIALLPIVDENNKLINIITKKQFQVLLLKDVEYSLKMLPEIDEYEMDFEVFSKPWGFYKSTLLAKHVQSKIITVFPGGELSLQKHKRREEHWIIIKGEGKIILEDSILNVEQGRYVYIPKNCLHKIINSSKVDNLIFAEVQLGDYFGEDDIIRYEDKYGRTTKGNKNGI